MFWFKRGNACYFHVLEDPRKTQRTMVNRQRTHAMQRGNRQRPSLCNHENFLGFQEQE